MALKEKRYEFVTSQIRYHNDKMIDAFKYFVSIFSLIIGGVFWLLSQQNLDCFLKAFVVGFSPYLTLLIGTTSILLIISNYVSWWGYRKAETALTDGDVVPPSFPKSANSQILMILVILISIVAFWHCSGKFFPSFVEQPVAKNRI
jgi:hypothetical protein